MTADSREVIAHLARALSRHLLQCRLDGIPVPAQVQSLTALMHDLYAAHSATARQGATAFVDLPRGNEAEGMASGVVLLSKAGVSRALACSVRTVERLLAAGELRSVSMAGQTRIRREDLDAYVASLAPKTFRDRVERKESA